MGLFDKLTRTFNRDQRRQKEGIVHDERGVPVDEFEKQKEGELGEINAQAYISEDEKERKEYRDRLRQAEQDAGWSPRKGETRPYRPAEEETPEALAPTSVGSRREVEVTTSEENQRRLYRNHQPRDKFLTNTPEDHHRAGRQGRNEERKQAMQAAWGSDTSDETTTPRISENPVEEESVQREIPKEEITMGRPSRAA